MTGWELLEYAAWAIAALVAAWLIYDAYRIGHNYDEEFLVHTLEDLGEESDWQTPVERTDSSGGHEEGTA